MLINEDLVQLTHNPKHTPNSTEFTKES